jgi:hypothetical protein
MSITSWGRARSRDRRCTVCGERYVAGYYFDHRGSLAHLRVLEQRRSTKRVES